MPTYRELKIKEAGGLVSVGDPRTSSKADASTVTAHTGASTGVHGVTGSVVGTTDVQTLSRKTLLTPSEQVNVVNSGFAGTGGWWVGYANITYYTVAATSNGIVNLTWDGGTNPLNNMMATGSSLTVVLLITNGATAYYPTGVSIDGTAQTVKWLGGTAPTAGNANAIDAYTYTVVKTAANTYTVLASVVKFA